MLNCLVLLIAPRRVFDLPRYLCFVGNEHRRRLSTLSGRLELRALGFCGVTGLLFIFRIIITQPPGSASTARSRPSVSPPFFSLWFLALSVAAVVTGALVALNPEWWYERYGRPTIPTRFEQDAVRARPFLIRLQRICGILCAVSGALCGWVSIQPLLR
jgi:hypothetical protein